MALGVGVARCGLIGLCFGTASLRLRFGGWAESAEMASLHAGKIGINRTSRGIASTLKSSGPTLHRWPQSVSSTGADACPMFKSRAEFACRSLSCISPGHANLPESSNSWPIDEWWHRRDQAPIHLGTLSPVATHGLLSKSFLWIRYHID